MGVTNSEEVVGDLDRGSLVGITRYGMLSQLVVKICSSRMSCPELDIILCCIDSSSGFRTQAWVDRLVGLSSCQSQQDRGLRPEGGGSLSGILRRRPSGMPGSVWSYVEPESARAEGDAE